MKIDAIKNQIINADFRDYIRDLPDKCVDLLLTDPPYGINVVEQLVRKNPNENKHGYRPWILKDWDKERPTEEDFLQMFRVSKNQIIWGGNYFVDFLPISQGWLVWDKGQRNFSLADGELAWTSYDKALRIFSYSRSRALKDGKIHPTQKPVALFEWILNLRTKENDLILDCYSGSGTTAIACQNTGRNFICFEKDSDYFAKSIQRLKDNATKAEAQRMQQKLIKQKEYYIQQKVVKL